MNSGTWQLKKIILQHSTGLSKSFDPISTKWTWKLQWKINYSQMPSTQFEMIFPVLWLLLLPLEFQRNETETMTNVEAADKRQAGRREGQESQGGAGKEEAKKIRRFFKAHKWNLFAENWSDMGETVTDVAWAGAWSVSRGLKRALTDTCCAHSRVGPISERQEIKSGEKMGWRGDMKLISHPINVTDDTQHNISACRGPRGPWEMNICPIDLSHLIQS